MKKSAFFVPVLLATVALGANSAIASPDHGHHGYEHKSQQSHAYKYKNANGRTWQGERGKHKKQAHHNQYRHHDARHASWQSLPPGLQKNVNRGKPLPPAWANRLNGKYYITVPYQGQQRYILNRDVYLGAPVISHPKNGVVRIRVSDRILDVVEATRVILNVL